MAYCPNISDEQVVKEFNSIVEHFGIEAFDYGGI